MFKKAPRNKDVECVVLFQNIEDMAMKRTPRYHPDTIMFCLRKELCPKSVPGC